MSTAQEREQQVEQGATQPGDHLAAELPGAAAVAGRPGPFAGIGTARGRAIGWFWILFWLMFLVRPVAEGWSAGGSDRLGALLLVAGALAYVATMRFAVRSMWRRADHSPSLRNPTSVICLTGSATVCICMVLAAVLMGQNGFGLLPYAVVILAMGIRWPTGPALAGAVALATSVLAQPLVGEPLESGLLFSALASAAASALGAYSIGRNFAARQAEREANLMRIQDERNRMARDLHDILGHSLTVITMKAELAGRLVDLDPAKAKVQIEELEQLSRSALADVRRTVSGYREISLAGELARARAALGDAGIRADLPGTVDDVSPDLRELFAWVVRESTTNIIRHSGARHASIALGPTRIRVHDDGRGATAGHGNGLSGLAERAAAAGAALTTTGDHGFTVVVEVPSTTSPGRAS